MSNATTAKKDAQDKAHQAGDKAQGVLDKGREMLGHAGEAVASAAGAVGSTVDQGVSAVGSGMQSLGDMARKNLPSEGYMGAASKAVAQGLDSAGKYVEEKSLSGMTEDIGSLIKNHPIPAVLIGVGIGYLLGRALRS
jgi:ElaB/YqjD/DUF883 family membrane-anchored ribosome-binding protein